MVVFRKSNLKSLWLLTLISIICSTNARQIRYSRYNTEVIGDNDQNENSTDAADSETFVDDNEVEATVREVKLAPYPASGFRPSRAFPLPNEVTTQSTDSDIVSLVAKESTLESTTDLTYLATTTQAYESETTTIANTVADNLNEDDTGKEIGASKDPYPAAGFQPRIPFLLPTFNSLNGNQRQSKLDATEFENEATTEFTVESKENAPYAAAGFRPSKAFLLPSEQLQLDGENMTDSKTKTDNSKHPVCGSSTNPLAPKPLDGEKEDPDSEPITPRRQEKSQQRRPVVIPVRFSVQPLLLTRPLVYSAPIPPSW